MPQKSVTFDMNPIPPVERCKAHKKIDGSRCKNRKVTGLEVCFMHGGATKRSKAKTAIAKAQVAVTKQMKAYGEAVDETHVGANPVSGLLWEIRRTAGHIIAIQEQIDQLGHGDVIWGRAKEERRKEFGGEFGGIDSDTEVDEARINIWITLYHKERSHYAQLCRIAISAGLEERRIRAQEAVVMQLNGVITNIIANLGQDPSSPAIRSMVRTELLAIQGPDE